MTLDELCQAFRTILDAIDNHLDDLGLDNSQRERLRNERARILAIMQAICPDYLQQHKKVKRKGQS